MVLGVMVGQIRGGYFLDSILESKIWTPPWLTVCSTVHWPPFLASESESDWPRKLKSSLLEAERHREEYREVAQLYALLKVTRPAHA